MKPCPRCGRNHVGLCGVPAGVALGFGARVGSSSLRSANPSELKGKPKAIKHSVVFLKDMLRQARMHEKELADVISVLPVELLTDDVMDNLGKVEALILQLNLQIIERESK